MNYIDFLFGLEEVVSREITTSFPFEWDENHITYSILKEIRLKYRHNPIQIDWFDEALRINWTAFKYTGISERNYGDIGILINIKFKDGYELEGAAFLEAKRRYKGRTTFSALKYSQLTNISKRTPHLMVLLYDYNDITDFISKRFCFPNRYRRNDWYRWKPTTHSVVVPSNIVLKKRAKDTSLYRFSSSFVEQLCLRYFRGLDLELDDTHLKIAKGYLREKFGVPKYLFRVSIGHGQIPPKEEADVAEGYTEILQIEDEDTLNY